MIKYDIRKHITVLPDSKNYFAATNKKIRYCIIMAQLRSGAHEEVLFILLTPKVGEIITIIAPLFDKTVQRFLQEYKIIRARGKDDEKSFIHAFLLYIVTHGDEYTLSNDRWYPLCTKIVPIERIHVWNYISNPVGVLLERGRAMILIPHFP